MAQVMMMEIERPLENEPIFCSIEEAIAKGIPPCGAITGIARLKSGATTRHVGVVLSNLEFQAGAFDMAACEKFCKLLVECARRELPIIAFISSGGMQTKEGAGALTRARRAGREIT